MDVLEEKRVVRRKGNGAAKLPVYEVEFIPAERRLVQRRSPLQQMSRTLPQGERRTSPGRREEDWEALRPATPIKKPRKKKPSAR